MNSMRHSLLEQAARTEVLGRNRGLLYSLVSRILIPLYLAITVVQTVALVLGSFSSIFHCWQSLRWNQARRITILLGSNLTELKSL